jgi:hypothetical protein
VLRKNTGSSRMPEFPRFEKRSESSPRGFSNYPR